MHNYYRSCLAAEKSPDRSRAANLLQDINNRSMWGSEERYKFIRTYGFALVTNQEIDLIADFVDSPILSIGCGTGYIDQFLRFANLEVISTDLVNPLDSTYDFREAQCAIELLEASQAIVKYPDHAVLTSWPCYDERWAYSALACTKLGTKIIYIGEGSGGCTGDDNLHEFLESKCTELAHSSMLQWSGIHDNLTIYERTLL
jgi:hypothetical protein